MKFTKKYFDHLYPRNETIDGDYNSKDHAEYLSATFKLMGIHVSRIFDFGFGKGGTIHAYNDFNIKYIYAVEPNKKYLKEAIKRMTEMKNKDELIEHINSV